VNRLSRFIEVWSRRVVCILEISYHEPFFYRIHKSVLHTLNKFYDGKIQSNALCTYLHHTGKSNNFPTSLQVPKYLQVLQHCDLLVYSAMLPAVL
jgi:hypothetical protein